MVRPIGEGAWRDYKGKPLHERSGVVEEARRRREERERSGEIKADITKKPLSLAELRARREKNAEALRRARERIEEHDSLNN